MPNPQRSGQPRRELLRRGYVRPSVQPGSRTTADGDAPPRPPRAARELVCLRLSTNLDTAGRPGATMRAARANRIGRGRTDTDRPSRPRRSVRTDSNTSGWLMGCHRSDALAKPPVPAACPTGRLSADSFTATHGRQVWPLIWGVAGRAVPDTHSQADSPTLLDLRIRRRASQSDQCEHFRVFRCRTTPLDDHGRP